MSPAQAGDRRRTTPLAVAPSADGEELRIEWSDGHVSAIPLPALRRACPCATCADERAKRVAASGAHSPSGLRIVSGPALADLAISRIVAVGRYAVQIVWADGHETGIFSFEQLRALCPCETCRRPDS